MPYKSKAQQRFFHSSGAKKAGISSGQVKEFDKATGGKRLPERVTPPKSLKAVAKLRRGMKGSKK